MTSEKLADALRQAEEALGENLVWITDQADLGVRQKDPETLRRLAQLEGAWKALVNTLAQLPKDTCRQFLKAEEDKTP